MKKKGSRNPAKAIKLVKTLISTGMNKSAAARILGVTPGAVAQQVRDNPLVRSALEAYLDEMQAQGLDDKASVKVIKDAFSAERTISVEDAREDAAGPKGGKSFTNVTEPDHNARLKANDQYLKVKKLLADTKTNGHAPAEQHVHFHYRDKKTEELLGEIGNQLAAFGIRKPDSARKPS